MATAIVRGGGGSSSSTASSSASTGPASTAAVGRSRRPVAPAPGSLAQRRLSAATNGRRTGVRPSWSSLGAMPAPARWWPGCARPRWWPPRRPARRHQPGPPGGAGHLGAVASVTAAAGARVPLGTPPVLDAQLTYRDMPADVFVFQVGALHVAEVTSETGCGPLAHLTF